MKKSLLTFITVFSSVAAFAQGVAINTSGTNADSSAILDISSTSKGLLIPRMDSAARASVVHPAKGLLVYDSTSGVNQFFYFKDSSWVSVGTGVTGGGGSTSGGSAYWAENGRTVLSSVSANSNYKKIIIGDSSATMNGTEPYSPAAQLCVIGNTVANTFGSSTPSNNALYLGAGNASGVGNNQILFGYAGLRKYQHRIVTRHSGTANNANAIDFYVWTTNATPDVKPGFKNSFLIDGTGKVSINNISSSATVATAPHSNLQVNGSFAAAVSTISAATTLDETYYFVVCNAGASVTLPAASGAYAAGVAATYSASGRIYIISNATGAAMTISSYKLPDGTTSTSVAAGVNLQLISDGTAWRKMN